MIFGLLIRRPVCCPQPQHSIFVCSFSLFLSLCLESTETFVGTRQTISTVSKGSTTGCGGQQGSKGRRCYRKEVKRFLHWVSFRSLRSVGVMKASKRIAKIFQTQSTPPPPPLPGLLFIALSLVFLRQLKIGLAASTTTAAYTNDNKKTLDINIELFYGACVCARTIVWGGEGKNQ